MPLQPLMPGFPEDATRIAYGLHVLLEDGIATHMLGGGHFFRHRVEDASSYHFVLALLMDNGHVRPCELEAAPLCIPHRTLMNWLARLRTRGPDSFFRNGSRAGAAVMTPARVAHCEQLLAGGLSPAAAARQAGIGDSVLRKALARGTVRRPGPDTVGAPACAGSTKSERSRADAGAAPGLGTAIAGRMFARWL